MLALTDSAKDALRQIVEDQQAPHGSGLRIAAESSNGSDGSLAFDLAAEPSAGDTIVEDGGARVFLDETAAAMLEDKVLDATAHEDHVHLTVEDQDSGAEA
jgi:iron-sulfur cluster assembly protein